MLNQGLLLLIAGMGTVYVFLSLMVLVMLATGKFFQVNEARFRPQRPAPTPGTATDNSEADVIAVVLAAISAHSRK